MEEKKDLQEENNLQEEMTAKEASEKEVEEAVENEAEPAEDTASEETKDTADEETSEEAKDAADEEEEAEEDKPLFVKKKKKDKKDEKIEELTDRVQRQMAEFDNYRKRTEKEKSQMFEMGAKSILEKLLPVVDNFERGLAAIDESEKDSSIASGMDMIYKQLETMLEESGVKPIEAEGKQFDPDYHNAVMHVEDEAYGESIVVQELQKGYMYKDSVLRYSMVNVAN